MKLLRLLTGVGTLAAGLLGGIYLWSLLSSEHDADAIAVTLVFDSVQGLHEGAAVHYRGVRVGEVRQIRLGGGGDAAEVLCSFEPWARSTLRVTSRFWVVRPRFLGVVRGVSGLETLVKDSYVTYSSPTGSALLPMHARVPGLATPPEGGTGSALPPPHPGDLEITVVFSDSRGLEAGDPVRHRGLPVGVVSGVELARDAGGVVVAARIDRRYRRAVTDESRFWVAQPSIDVGWLRGLDVHDIDALLAGAYLTFYTPERRSAAPTTDGSVFVGEPERPDFDWERPDATQVGDDGGTAAPAPKLSAHLVRVHYTF